MHSVRIAVGITILAGIGMVATFAQGPISTRGIEVDKPVTEQCYVLDNGKFVASGHLVGLTEIMSFRGDLKEPAQGMPIFGNVTMFPEASNQYHWEVEFTGLAPGTGYDFEAGCTALEGGDTVPVKNFELSDDCPEKKKKGKTVEQKKQVAATKTMRPKALIEINNLMKITAPKPDQREINLFFQTHLTVRGTVLAAGHTIRGYMTPVAFKPGDLQPRGIPIDHGRNWQIHFIDLLKLKNAVGTGRYYWVVMESIAPSGLITHMAMEKIKLINVDHLTKDGTSPKKARAK